MCRKNYALPDMLPYSTLDRENALRLAAEERWDRMLHSNRKNKKNERRSAK